MQNAPQDAADGSLSIRELEAQITGLAGHLNAANHRWLELIAEFDGRNAWSDGATRSCAHWLSWKCGLDFGAALDRSIPPALRRALAARDMGCVFPGCNHKRYVDGHNIGHWAHGGATWLSNLVTLCRFHHRSVHDGGLRMERCNDGAWRFFNPRGESLYGCAPGHTQPLGDWRRLPAEHAGRGSPTGAQPGETPQHGTQRRGAWRAGASSIASSSRLAPSDSDAAHEVLADLRGEPRSRTVTAGRPDLRRRGTHPSGGRTASAARSRSTPPS
jgi:hypothetical protein